MKKRKPSSPKKHTSSSPKKRKPASPAPRLAARGLGHRAASGDYTLRSETVGALPIVEHFLRRMRLEEFLESFLPPHDRRTTVPAARVLAVMVKNVLLSREPLYALGAWAAGHDPTFLGLSPEQALAWNDDRAGRALFGLFRADRPSLVLALMRHGVAEFRLKLDELHNDSTTISFTGAYPDAAREKTRRGKPTPAITWGHNKDHRPDLKQLLYLLTVTGDGGVPVSFRVASGNVADDRTHPETWDLLCVLAGRRDFLYVADCKLATVENMSYIAQRGGRFVSVLPRTRREDGDFRGRVRRGEVVWQFLWDKTDDDGELLDRFSVCPQPDTLPEGFRLWWFHSTRKAALDLDARGNRLRRAEQHLRDLQTRLRSPRSRLREEGKVHDQVAEVLRACDVAELIQVRIAKRVEETFRQSRRGRPTKDMLYVKQESVRFDLEWTIDERRLLEESRTDGIFPLVTNDTQLGPLDLLLAYKRQPQIEKRFEQLKTDYTVAPVFLKDVARIEAFLAVYFFALLTESLVERELRQAMEREGLATLPLYPEDRDCRRPTARRLFEVFETIQRHEITRPGSEPVVLRTELSPLQRQLLRLLGVPASLYQ